MARIFVLIWPDRQHDDSEGTVCDHDAGAYEYAERIVRELKSAGGYDDPDLMMVVQNAARVTLFSVPF